MLVIDKMAANFTGCSLVYEKLIARKAATKVGTFSIKTGSKLSQQRSSVTDKMATNFTGCFLVSEKRIDQKVGHPSGDIWP